MIRWKESATVNGVLLRNGSKTGYAVKTENTVLPSGTPYIMSLEEKIHDGSTIVATLDGVPAEIIPWSFSPTAGKLAVDRPHGRFKYAAADASKAISFQYVPVGTMLDVAKIDALFDGIEGGGGGGEGSTVEHHTVLVSGVPDVALVGKIYVPARDLDERTITRISVFAGDASSLTAASETTLYVTAEATAISGAAVTLETNGTVDWAVATPALAIDTSGGDVVLNVFCIDNAGGHGNLNLEVTVE